MTENLHRQEEAVKEYEQQRELQAQCVTDLQTHARDTKNAAGVTFKKIKWLQLSQLLLTFISSVHNSAVLQLEKQQQTPEVLLKFTEWRLM